MFSRVTIVNYRKKGAQRRKEKGYDDTNDDNKTNFYMLNNSKILCFVFMLFIYLLRVFILKK